jgi:peptidoglycan hydrolase CwlO-like protein
VSASQEAVAQFQKRVDDRVRSALEGFQSVPELKREIQTLQERIAELEKRLAELRKD